jgi:hypothetical protein
MSDPAPTPANTTTLTLASLVDDLKTFALGFVIAVALYGQIKNPTPAPIPTPVPIPVPTPPSPVPTPVPVPPTPTPPQPIPPTPTPVPPAPVVSDFFRVGQAYGKALATAYGDAWDGGFQIKPGDDVGAKLAAVKSAWDAARTAQFGATVAPEFEKLAPDRKAVDQATADALNKARADFVAGLRSAG